MIIMNKNDIDIYFITIEQLEPKNILDIGMFLKRTGIIIRTIPESVQLDSIDLFPEVDLLVWNQLYDNIYDKE